MGFRHLRLWGSRAASKVAVAAALLNLSAAAAGAEPAIVPIDSPAVLAHIAKAQALAGSDLQKPLFLCRADSGSVVRQALEVGSTHWLAPTRLFDNLFYIGNEFVGVLALKTSRGLILFDSGESPEDARDHLAPGLVAFGLDPKTIRYVIVTHGHWDHFGGAAWLQKTYGARVGLSQADWTMIESSPRDAPGVYGHAAPARDVVVADGQALTLGDTTVRLYLTPGHTPGTISAIIPARERGRTYALSLLGSVAFPPTLQPTPTTGGLRAYDRSVRRFAEISRAAGARAMFNTHVFADGGLERLAAARARAGDAPNPFLVGADAIGRYYDLLDECLQAAIARPHGPEDAGKVTVPEP